MKKIIKTVCFVTVISVVTRALSFVFRIYVSRLIGAEELGVYQIALSNVFTLATLTSGLPLVISRSVARYRATYDLRSEKTLMSSATILGLAVSCIVVTLVYLGKDSLIHVVSDPRAVPLLLVMAPAVITSTIYSIGRSWFWGRKQYFGYCMTEFVECIVRVALGVMLLNGVVSGLSGAYANAVSFTLSDMLCSIMIVICFFVKGGRFSRPKELTPLIKSVAPLTVVRTYSSLIQSITALIVPMGLVAQGMSQSVAIAEYGRAMGMAMPLLMAPTTLTGSMSVVLVPESAEMNATSDKTSLCTRTEGTIFASILCTAMFVALYLPFGAEIGGLLYGDALAGNYVSYASVIIFPIGLSQIASTMLNSIGLEKKTLSHYVLGSLCMLAIQYLLTPVIGIYSVFVSMGACYTVVSVLHLITLKKAVGISLKCMKPLGFTAVTIAIASICGYYLKDILSYMPTIYYTLLSSGVVVVIFALSMGAKYKLFDRYKG